MRERNAGERCLSQQTVERLPPRHHGRSRHDDESGTARPAELLEWLVATTEEPATRKEAIYELSGVSPVRLNSPHAGR